MVIQLQVAQALAYPHTSAAVLLGGRRCCSLGPELLLPVDGIGPWARVAAWGLSVPIAGVGALG